VDHYQFREALQGATKAKPLALKEDSSGWWNDYYDAKNIKNRTRLFFVR
jgi:hypothetical protein